LLVQATTNSAIPVANVAKVGTEPESISSTITDEKSKQSEVASVSADLPGDITTHIPSDFQPFVRRKVKKQPLFVLTDPAPPFAATPVVSNSTASSLDERNGDLGPLLNKRDNIDTISTPRPAVAMPEQTVEKKSLDNIQKGDTKKICNQSRKIFDHFFFF
jgi:hypothetical protein